MSRRYVLRKMIVSICVHLWLHGFVSWPLLMAGSLLVILPVLLLYAVAQRQFVEGITCGAIKG